MPLQQKAPQFIQPKTIAVAKVVGRYLRLIQFTSVFILPLQHNFRRKIGQQRWRGRRKRCSFFCEDGRSCSEEPIGGRGALVVAVAAIDTARALTRPDCSYLLVLAAFKLFARDHRPAIGPAADCVAFVGLRRKTAPEALKEQWRTPSKAKGRTFLFLLRSFSACSTFFSTSNPSLDCYVLPGVVQQWNATRTTRTPRRDVVLWGVQEHDLPNGESL